MRSVVVTCCVFICLATALEGGNALPLPEKFIVHSSEKSPREGQTLALNCIIGGPPQAFIPSPSSYEWVKDGKVIPSEMGQTLTIEKLSVQDEGDYQCGPLGSDVPSDVFHLDVIRSETSPINGIMFYVDKFGSTLQGRTATLRCYLFGLPSVHPSSYQWLKDAKVIADATHKDLPLKSLSSNDTGDYLCGDPSMKYPRRNYHLQVITILPTPTIFKDRLPVCGHPFSLNCLIMVGYSITADTAYNWYKDSTEIKGQTGPVLWFDNVTEADTGKYTCTARDGPMDTTSHHSQAFDLDPLMNPELRIEQASPNSLLKGVVGENLTLTCEVIRSNPIIPYNGYSWSFLPHHQIHSRPLAGTSRTLTLGPLTKEDAGQYFCQARNDQSETVTLIGQASVTVDILYLDNISVAATPRINESDYVTITCKVDSHPSAHLVWVVNGKEVRHVIDNLDHYVIPKAACTDSTHYTCHASNADLPGRNISATTRLLINCEQAQELGGTRQENIPVWVIVLVIVAAIVIVSAIRIIVLRQLIPNSETENHPWNELRELSTESPIKVDSHNFENLYENGEVYIFPQLVPPNQGETTISDDELDPLLSQSLDPTSKAAEFTFKNVVRFVLQNTIGPDSLPSFLLHNTCLNKLENVLLILHRKWGIILIVVKPFLDQAHQDSIDRACDCLHEAKKIVKEKVRGLVKSMTIRTAIAFPYTSEKDEHYIKPLKSSRLKWNVEMLLGQDKEAFSQWAEDPEGKPGSDVWDLSEVGSPDAAFKMAASRFLTLEAIYHPEDSSEGTNASKSWLLTSDQMKVKDSAAKLLHIWGSPGSGKTKLLIHRARQWLAEDKAVVLTGGRGDCDVLLAMIAREVRRNQSDSIRKKIRICYLYSELQQTLKELRGQYPGQEICLAIDTLWDPELIRTMLQAVKSQQVTTVWCISRDNLPDIDQDLSEEACELGWESLMLPDTIRSTDNTVELLNQLIEGSYIHSPISAPSDLPARDIPKWRVVDHCSHTNHSTTMLNCNQCKAELSDAHISPDQHPPWSNWIALFTGNPNEFTDIKPIYETLKRYQIQATLDKKYENIAGHGSHLDSVETDISQWHERVVAGVDETGEPSVHLVRVRDSIGIWKEGVLMVHWDKRDNDPNCQSQADRDARLAEHRYLWFLAVSRSKGQVLLLLLTPSPARSLLRLPEAVMPIDEA